MLRRSIQVNEKQISFMLITELDTALTLYKSLLAKKKQYNMSKTVYTLYDVVLFRKCYDLCIGVI